MNIIISRIVLLVAGGLLLILSTGTFAADQLIVPDPSDYDYFGTAVGIDGDLAVVGAPNYDTAAYATRSSRVYLFQKTGSDWTVGSLQANDSFEEKYGTSVAISDDTIIVGAYETDVTIGEEEFIRAGAAYIYTPDGVGGWNVQKLIAPDSGSTYSFGYSVDIDGDIAIVGAPRNRPGQLEPMNGAAYVFYRNADGLNNWGFVKKITASDPHVSKFGHSVSISGTTLAVGAPLWNDGDYSTGAVYLYDRNFDGADNWGEITRITSDAPATYLQFGEAVSLDTETLAVGTYQTAKVYIYERNLGDADNWGRRITIVPTDAPGNTYGMALSIDGDLLAVGAYYDPEAGSGAGSTYFYYRDQDGTNAWGLVEKLLHPTPDVNDNQRFGCAVSLSTSRILIGASHDDALDGDGAADDQGSAFVFVPCDALGGDVDADDVCGDIDNCPSTYDPEQSDVNNNGIGDACDSSDTDGDGLADDVDPEPAVYNSPLDNDTAFVRQVYLDFLNREPEADGLTYWVGQLDAELFDRSELVEQYLNSAEFGVTISPVVRLYFTYYQRIPDYDGLMFWVNSYAAGVSLNDVSDAFATAQEFIDRYGSVTNEEFVSQMYINVYGRQPDAGGLAYWTGFLDSNALTRGEVMVFFSSAEEYLQLSANHVYVTMTYMGLLRRAPELEGFDFWVNSMDLGVSGLGLIDNFLASDEYEKRFTVLP